MRKKAKPPRRNYQVQSESGNKFIRKKRIKRIFFISILVLFILIFVSGQRGSYQLYKFTKQANELEQEIKKISAEINKLEKEKEQIINDPAYIEKIAREKYKMKKEGEEVYQIVEE